MCYKPDHDGDCNCKVLFDMKALRAQKDKT